MLYQHPITGTKARVSKDFKVLVVEGKYGNTQHSFPGKPEVVKNWLGHRGFKAVQKTVPKP